jgi:hypothetical protein
MQPLTRDDLVPLAEYVARRAEFLDAHLRYCDRYRRVRVGPSATLVFENRQTLWFRIQEVLRVARIADPELVQHELDWYNRLLPKSDHLQAVLVIDELSGLDLPGEAVRLVLDDAVISATELTGRPEDRAARLTQWLEFGVFPAERQLLRDRKRPAHIEVEHAGYQHASTYLSDEIRQSLLDDLKPARRGAA